MNFKILSVHIKYFLGILSNLYMKYFIGFLKLFLIRINGFLSEFFFINRCFIRTIVKNHICIRMFYKLCANAYLYIAKNTPTENALKIEKNKKNA